MKTAILVDEMRVIHQLHKLGIEGFSKWEVLYEAIEEHYCTGDTQFHFYGANVPKNLEPQRFKLRSRFFSALTHQGIHVHKGFTVVDHNRKFVEKGIDVLLTLDLMDLSLDGYDEIILMTSNSSCKPAIVRAKDNGTVVRAIISKKVAAGVLASVVDEVIPLEDVLELIPAEHKKQKMELVKEDVVA